MVQRSWRSTKQAHWLLRRSLLRLFSAAIVSALLIGLLVLLVVPFRRPQAHLVVLAAESRNPLDNTLLDYLPQDIRSLEVVGERLVRRGAVTGPIVLDDLDSRDVLSNLTDNLEQFIPTGRDTLVLYVSGAAAVENSGIQILCGDSDANHPDRGRVTFRELLDRVSDCRAAQKLLVLDVGRADYDRRLGILANVFPELLQDEVTATRDEQVWVLTSSATLERSQVAWSLERSVFSYFVTRGLDGAADLDGDQDVAVDELYRYVVSNVGAMAQARADGCASQTPQLFWGGGPLSAVNRYPELVTVGSRAGTAANSSGAESQALASAIAASRETSRIASSYGLVRVPAASEIARSATAQLVPFRMPGGPAGMLLNDAASQLPQAALPQAIEPSAAKTQVPPAEPQPAAAAGTPTSSDHEAEPGKAAPAGPEAGKLPPAQGAPPKATPLPAAPADSDPQATERRGAGLLAEAWQLRDRLAVRPARQPAPLDFAPHLWRELQHQLLSFERRFRAGAVEKTAFHEDLQEFVVSLRQLANGERVTSGAPETVAARIDQLRFTAWPAGDAARSLGLARNLAAWSGKPLSPTLEKPAQALDRFVAEGTAEEFEKWASNEVPAAAHAFCEFWLAKRLAEEPAIGWADKQLALRVARYGEQVAGECLPCLPWVRGTIELADRRRLEGERALFDRIGVDWLPDARHRLAEAESLYHQATAAAQAVFAAQHACHDLADRSWHYLHWHGMVEATPATADPATDLLARLLQTLAETFALLEQPDAAQLERLLQLHRQLRDLQTKMELAWPVDSTFAQADNPGQVLRVESLLATSAPAAEIRLRLVAALPEMEHRRLAAMSFPDLSGPTRTAVPASRRQWQRLAAQVRLELALARLAAFRPSSGLAPDADDCPDLQRLNAACQTLERTVAGTASSRECIRAISEYEAESQSFFRELPRRVRRATGQASNLEDESTRPRQLLELSAALRGLRYVDPRDARMLDGIDLSGMLARAALYDHLAWHRERLLQANADAAHVESDYLSQSADTYRELASQVGGQPHIAPLAPELIAVDGPSSISLAASEQGRVNLTFRNTGSRPLAIWLVVQYDPRQLQIAVPTGQACYRQHELAASPRQQSGSASPEGQPAYPPRSDVLSLPQTLDLGPGKSAQLALHVQQSQSSVQPPAFIAKAIARVEEGLAGYVRHRVDVELPTSESVEVQVSGSPGTWSSEAGRLILHPFPNRSTAFQFRLRNLTQHDRPVEVLILGSDRLAADTVPQGALSVAESERVLGLFAPTRVLVPRYSTVLPQNGQPVVIASPPPAAAEGKAETGNSKPETSQAAPAAKASDGQESLADPLPNSLLCIITDTTTGRQIIRQIGCEVQRPRRFLRPRVGYDPERERIDVRIVPLAADVLPDGPVHVQVESIGDVPPGTKFRLEADISSQQPEAHLFARMPAERARVVALQIHVDGYPRAFIYDVPCWDLVEDIPERAHPMEVRITNLPAGTVYRVPAAKIPAEVQVDAPAGSFEDGDDELLVGIDQDSDRELVDDPCLTLRTDRQVRVSLQEIAADGTWTVQSTVGDFLLDLPTATTSSGRMSALAQLSVAGRTVWSESKPLVLDGLPPRILQPALKPGADVRLGTELQLSVLASDDNLSGVAKVEAAFDLKGTGTFADEPKPVAAEQDATTGAWVAKIPCKELPAGSYPLLLRATDQVGNVGNYETITVRLLSVDESAPAGVNQVTGTVLYGQQPVSGAELTLTGEKSALPKIKSNDQGNFIFPQVPPGKYKLTARALVHNKFRTAEAEIEVKAPPAAAVMRELRVQ